MSKCVRARGTDGALAGFRRELCKAKLVSLIAGFCLLKGIAEGTYNSKHAEAARLYIAGYRV